MINNKILVTGTKSGIGKYIHEQLGGTEFTRQSNNLNELKKQSFDVIIHCAWNSVATRLVTNENLGQYYYDNALLTQELLQIPHEYFVFFSTVDIYPEGQKFHSEDEVIYTDFISTIHGITKLISETVVQAKANNFLILRPVSMLGSYMRKNNLLKLFEDPHPSLALTATSVYNMIHYPDVLGFIRSAIDRGETGIFNLASASNISLTRIAEITGKKVVFGDYLYKTRNILNEKATRIFSAFNKTSEEVLKEFLAQKNKTV